MAESMANSSAVDWVVSRAERKVALSVAKWVEDLAVRTVASLAVYSVAEMAVH